MRMKHQPPPRSHTPTIEYSVPSGMYDCIRTEHVSLVGPRRTPTLPKSAATTTTTITITAINAPTTTPTTTTVLESQEWDDNGIQYRRTGNTNITLARSNRPLQESSLCLNNDPAPTTTTTTLTVVPEGVRVIAITPQPTTNRDSIMSSVFLNDDDDDSWTWSEDLHLDHRNRPSNERLLVRCLFRVRGWTFSFY